MARSPLLELVAQAGLDLRLELFDEPELGLDETQLVFLDGRQSDVVVGLVKERAPASGVVNVELDPVGLVKRLHIQPHLISNVKKEQGFSCYNLIFDANNEKALF